MGKLIDLTGQRFGRLIVLQRAKNKGNDVQWLCQCDCGNQCIVSRRELRTGHTKSCGCLRKEKVIDFNKNTKSKDIINQRFGKLIVLSLHDKRKDGKLQWLCQCDCGTQVIIRGDLLRNGMVSSCGCLKSKGELLISQLLMKNNITFVKNQTFPSCRSPKTNTLLRFDFYILAQQPYCIEFDGIQHFKQIEFFNQSNSFEYRKELDEYKTLWCKINKMPLIRIPYTILKNLKIENLLLETSQFKISQEGESKYEILDN